MVEILEKIEELNKGFSTAFIDQTFQSNVSYRPELVINNYHQGKKVLVSIEEELTKCDEFYICVAFITKSGITVTGAKRTGKEKHTRKNINDKLFDV